MIELTREEALSILQTLAMFEGFLFSINNEGANKISHLLEEPVNLLTEKLKND
jgi:hypothetical protein